MLILFQIEKIINSGSKLVVFIENRKVFDKQSPLCLDMDDAQLKESFDMKKKTQSAIDAS